MGISNVQVRSVLSNLKPYVPGKPIWEVQQEFGIEHVIKLASNENSLGVSPRALEAIQLLLSDVHRYPDASAVTLREAIASVYDVPVEGVVVSNGADEMIKLISEAYLEIGDEVIIPTPTFTEYEFAAKLMGAEVLHVPLGVHFEYDMDAIIHAITPRTKLIYLCSPNNPTGTYLRNTQMDKLMTELPKGILVVVDAAYSHYVEGDDYADGLYFVRNGYPVIVIQTFSKVYGLAGLRVGFGLACREIMDNIQKVREPFNVNVLAQAAALAALQDTNHVERSVACVREGRDQLYRILDEVGLSYTLSSSNFILVEFGERAGDVYSSLLQFGIIVRSAESWGLPLHLRITVGTYDENEALGRALMQLEKAHLETFSDTINKKVLTLPQG